MCVTKGAKHVSLADVAEWQAESHRVSARNFVEFPRPEVKGYVWYGDGGVFCFPLIRVILVKLEAHRDIFRDLRVIAANYCFVCLPWGRGERDTMRDTIPHVSCAFVIYE